MNMLHHILLKVLKLILSNYRPTSMVRLQVLNLTRQAVLADGVEVADSGVKRRKGLLGRERLLSGEGLWITPCEAVHTFGMKFSIDLIYLDRGKRVIKVRTNVPPRRISVCFFAHSVLELKVGTIHETQTQTGDMIKFTQRTNHDSN
jgi:uncharacterized protein